MKVIDVASTSYPVTALRRARGILARPLFLPTCRHEPRERQLIPTP